MVEAIRTIAQIPTIRITTASRILAQLRARKAVKDSTCIRIKVCPLLCAHIARWAQLFLDQPSVWGCGIAPTIAK
jgi:hypothetical protein